MLAARFMTFVFFSDCPGEQGKGVEKERQEANIRADVCIIPARKHQSYEGCIEAAKNCGIPTAEHLRKSEVHLVFVPRQLRQFQQVKVKAQVSKGELNHGKDLKRVWLFKKTLKVF